MRRGAQHLERVRTQSAATVINEILMKAGRGMTASPRCPKNGNKSAQLSQKQKASQGQAPRPGFQRDGPPPYSTFPPVSGRARGRPPPSDYLRAGTGFERTRLDFPDLSSPLSDLPLLTYSLHPPTHTLSYSLSPFIPVQKQIIQAKCVSWLLEKVLCSMNCAVVTLQQGVGWWRWEGLLTAEQRSRGTVQGGCRDWVTGQWLGASLAPRPSQDLAWGHISQVS